MMEVCLQLAMMVVFIGPAGAQAPSCRQLQTGRSGHTQLQCSCSSLPSSPSLSSLSNIINPLLSTLRLRPGTLVSHLMLAGCSFLSLTLDLDSLDRTASAITDLSFEDISQLQVEFSSLQQSRMKFVFTNIGQAELSGRIEDRSASLDMFFRSTDRSRAARVTFSALTVDSTIRLLNFQDIQEVRVEGCSFRTISTLDIVHSTSCYDRVSGGPRLPCTKQDLFYASRYTVPTGPTPTDTSTSTNTRLPGRTNLIQATDKPEALSGVTTSPIFIVGMVLLLAVIVIVIVLGLYFRYQKNVQSWRVGLAGGRTRDNWFLRPSSSSQTSPSPGTEMRETRDEMRGQPGYREEMRGPSPISIVGEDFEPAREVRM